MILSGFSLEEPFNLMYSFVFYLQNFSHRCYYVATRQLNKNADACATCALEHASLSLQHK